MTTSSVSSGNSAADLQASLNQRRTDYQALASALNSGDLSAAQQAFAQLQKDSPRLAQAISSTSDTNGNPRVADLQSLSKALQSGDVSGAQQAFAKFQQDVQSVRRGGHHHHHAAAPSAATASAPAAGTDSGNPAVGSNLNVTI